MWQFDAGVRLEPFPALGNGGIVDGRRLLGLNPGLEVRARLGHHPDQHARVLHATVLGTLAVVDARLGRFEHHRVLVARDDVRLTRQTRHPEAMHHVGRVQPQPRPARMLCVGRRNVQFVRRAEAVLRVLEVPPPLMGHDPHAQFVAGSLRLAGLHEVPHYDQEQRQHDQQRPHRPGQLDGPAAVNLWRLLVRRSVAARTEADDAVEERAREHHENRHRDRQHEQEQLVDGRGRRRGRCEHRPCVVVCHRRHRHPRRRRDANRRQRRRCCGKGCGRRQLGSTRHVPRHLQQVSDRITAAPAEPRQPRCPTLACEPHANPRKGGIRSIHRRVRDPDTSWRSALVNFRSIVAWRLAIR